MITNRHEEILRHMLGADSRYKKKQWGFRNHYCIGPECDGYSDLVAMEKLGLVRGYERFGGFYFSATRPGAIAIGFKPYQLRKTELAQEKEGGES